MSRLFRALAICALDLVCSHLIWAAQIPSADKVVSESFLWKQSCAYEIRSIAVSPNGRLIAYSSPSFGIKVCDGATGAPGYTITGQDMAENLSFSDDGSLLLVINGTRLSLWNAENGFPIKDFNLLKVRPLEETENLHINDAVLNRDHQRLTCFATISKGESASSDIMVVWNIKDEQTLLKKELPALRYTQAKLSPAEDQLISSSPDGLIVLDALKGTILNKIDSKELHLIQACFSPDGKNILELGLTDTSSRLLPVNAYTLLRYEFKANKTPAIVTLADMDMSTILQNEMMPPSCWAFSPDGQFIAAGENDQIKIFNSSTGKLIRILKGITNFPVMLKISKDSSTLAVSNPDGIYVWKMPKLTASNKLIKKL